MCHLYAWNYTDGNANTEALIKVFQLGPLSQRALSLGKRPVEIA